MTPKKYGSFSDCKKNKFGGFYANGEAYAVSKKMEVVMNFFDLWKKTYPKMPTYTKVAEESQVSYSTARKFLQEFEKEGRIVDPKEKEWLRKYTCNKIDSVFWRLSLEEEAFLMSLHAQDPSRPNASYVDELKKEYGTVISENFVTQWFKSRYEYNGNFCKAIMVPTDKFKEANWFKYFEYRIMTDLVSNHQLFNFVDEKHIYNHNGHQL